MGETHRSPSLACSQYGSMSKSQTLPGYADMDRCNPYHRRTRTQGNPMCMWLVWRQNRKMVELVVMAGESVESSKLVDDDAAVVEDAWAVGMAA